MALKDVGHWLSFDNLISSNLDTKTFNAESYNCSRAANAMRNTLPFLNEPSRIEVAAPSKSPCPRCAYRPGAIDDFPPAALYHPWTVRDRAALFEYVHSLSTETHEWLLAFYVDNELSLLATETVAKGGLDAAPVDFGAILCRGRALGAKGFLLVHNHPSGDPTPSNTDIALTQRLRRISAEFELPLLDPSPVTK